ncbi:MAG: hypothetical protein ABR548_10085 [Actinomycetota bacterium]|nr:hypothetical protein [Actinomycetota bacterium]
MDEEQRGEAGLGMVIDCNDCVMQGTDGCNDCVVSYILDRPGGAVVFDSQEERAVRAMTRAGLLPLLKWEKKTS